MRKYTCRYAFTRTHADSQFERYTSGYCTFSPQLRTARPVSRRRHTSPADYTKNSF